MFREQNRETINSTWKVAASFKIIMTTSVTRPCFTTQHQNCKTKIKTETDFFWSQTGLVLRPHHCRGGNFIMANLHNHARTVWQQVAKFGTVTGGNKHASRGQPRPILRGGATASEKLLGLYLRSINLTHSEEIWCDKTRGRSERVPMREATPYPKVAGPQQPQF